MSPGHHITDAEAASVIYAAGLDPHLDSRALAHASECVECAAKLDALLESDRSAGALLDLLDVPAPKQSAAGLVRSAKARKRMAFGAPRRAAAGIIAFMVLAGVAAAAIPSSPLHRLIVDAFAGKRTATANVGRTRSPSPAASAGVSITPSSTLEIVFNERSAGSIHVRISDGEQAALSSTDATVTYRVGNNRITVSQSARAEFHLEVPRALRDLRIFAGDRLIFSRGAGTRMSADTLTIDLSARPRG